MRNYKPTLFGVLDKAKVALADNPTGRVELTPGIQPAWDDCCEGQLYLRIIEIFPTMGKESPFPRIDASQRGAAGSACTIHALAIHLGLGILRCAAVVQKDGAPTDVQVSADASQMVDDMDTLLDVIICQVPGVTGVMQTKLDRWVPLGPEGGCAGGEWSFYIAVDPCLCTALPE